MSCRSGDASPVDVCTGVGVCVSIVSGVSVVFCAVCVVCDQITNFPTVFMVLCIFIHIGITKAYFNDVNHIICKFEAALVDGVCAVCSLSRTCCIHSCTLAGSPPRKFYIKSEMHLILQLQIKRNLPE